MKTPKTTLKCGHTIFKDRCLECLKIQADFYLKLAQHHFEDIENSRYRDRPLKSWHAFKFSALDPQIVQARKKYFEAALRLLWEEEFSKEIHRQVWELHAEGKSTHEISQTLGGITHQGVNWIIHKYRNKLVIE